MNAIAAVRAYRAALAWAWLDRAERSVDDPDGQFVFLWIASNVAFATEIDPGYRRS